MIPLYIASVVLANVLVLMFGVIHIGFGLYAPAGVFAVGLVFTLRDFVHRSYGRKVSLLCIAAGAAISAVLSPSLALAALIAFGVSETVDLLLYEQSKPSLGFIPAVAISNSVALILDSVVFLWMAFGSLEFLPGQVVGKAAMTVLAVGILYAIRRRAAFA